MKRLFVPLLLSGCATLPDAPPHAFVPPQSATTAVKVCWVDTGGVTAPAGYGAGGAPTASRWEATAAALVIRHPKGDLVLDTGISRTATEDGKELNGWGRFAYEQTAARNQPRRDLAKALDALGVTAPLGLLLSHVHPDHAGGVASLPGVPVWLAREEKALVETELARPSGRVVPAVARAMENRMVALPFEATPWANYDAHYDVFGDGSVVVVPTFGHTPGSVATFITLSPTRRLVHVGDLINLQESITRNVGKSWLMRLLTDEDDEATQEQVAKLVQLHRADPGLVILPAHDRAAFVSFFGEDDGGVPPCAE